MGEHYMRGPPKTPSEEQTVTICVAAISQGMIFGASDRMVTAGDVQFEPSAQKVFGLTSSIAIMIAGDTALQTEILQGLTLEVNHHLQTKSDVWLNVRYIAERYAFYFGSLRQRVAERTFLTPLGLDYQSFHAKQKDMAPELVTRLATEMLNHRMPDIQALIVGVDTAGPHIYYCDNESMECQDQVGFAAIGVGYWHANSQFMFAGHSLTSTQPDTLWLTYLAKRRAEVAPSIGEATDMFWIGPQLGASGSVALKWLLAMEDIYKKARQSERRSNKNARERVHAYVQQLAEATAKEQAALGGEDAETPVEDATDRPALTESGEKEEPDAETPS